MNPTTLGVIEPGFLKAYNPWQISKGSQTEKVPKFVCYDLGFEVLGSICKCIPC